MQRWFWRSLFFWCVAGSLGWMLAADGAETGPVDAPFVVKFWRTPEGLPQNSVQAITQTPDGYLWVGTRGGLARFDGVRFTSYGLADGLKSLNIWALLEDGEGGLWIATIGGGLSRWRDGVISTLTIADGLAHNNVRALALAEPGALWVGTERGLQHWGPDGFKQIGAADGVRGSVIAMAVSPTEGLWLSVPEAGLFRCQDGRCELVEPTAKERALFPSSYLVDAEGAVWIGMGNGVVLRRHGGKWQEFNTEQGVPFSFIYCLAQGPSGEIWAGAHEAGLYVFREGRFHAVPGTDPSVRSIKAGQDGVVWVGTQTGGLSRLTRARVTSYPVENGSQRGQVNGLVEEPPGQFWVGTWGGGLFHGALDRLEPVLSLKELTDAPFLIAGLRMRDGAVVFMGERRLWRKEAGTAEIHGTLLPNDPRAICEGADGALWLGSREGEIMQLGDGAPQAVSNGKFPAPISALVRGSGSALWVTTQGAGLFCWDAGKVQRWTKAEGLPTDILLSLHRDAEDTLWIGTAGGGLAWLEAGRVHAVNARQGLGDEVISQILEDDQGNLWLGGNHGIFRVSKRELRAVAAGKAAAVHPLALDESDGMGVAECTGSYSPAGLRSQSGTLYFSTVRGVVAVDPKQFGPSAAPPAVLIEAAKLDGKFIALHGGTLTLPAGSRELEIHYTAFNYTKPEQLRFRHRLGGREGRWTEADGQRSVRYSQLPPGDYRFHVTAANPDGRWNETGASFAFTVQPFFWQTAWFRFAMVLVVMAASGGTVWAWARAHIRHAQERERLARAEAEAQQHLNELAHLSRVSTLGGLATTLAHELNQPLAAIHSNAEAAEIYLQKDTPDLPELRAIFGDIREDGYRAGEVIHRMRALLQRHQFKTERLEISGLVEALGTLLHGVITSRHARLRIEVAAAMPPVQGDAVHLQQLLLNLMLNALDAMADCPAAEREVLLRATATEAGWVEVSVTDRGPGFPAEKLAKLAEPFFTTKKDGMGMGLAICHSIVQSHGGRLTAENLPGSGAVVRFTLPASMAVA
jgi:signal transduction histidine kinase/ligand-binding sensor domain-containing protein